MHTYQTTQDGLSRVFYVLHDGSFLPLGEFSSEAAARARVSALNGGPSDDLLLMDEEATELFQRSAALAAKLEELVQRVRRMDREIALLSREVFPDWERDDPAPWE